MTKKQFVKCVKCGTVDDGKGKSHRGTSTKMICEWCGDVDTGIATMCRHCCPTGHGTREERGEQ